MKLKLIAMVICALIALSTTPAWGQEEKRWDFELAPLYLWAVNINGDLGVRGRTASADVEFSDIWDNLEGVFTVRFNALYRQKYGIIFDYNYLDLGTEKQEEPVDIDVGFKSQIVNLGGTYRLLNERHILDGVVGIRYTIADADVRFNNLGQKIENDEDWVDPIIGARYGFNMTEKWHLRLYGDIGGFGVSSDFTWQGLGLLDFQPWKHLAVVAGYRAIGTDYTSGSGTDKFTYDVIVHGPLIGIDIRW